MLFEEAVLLAESIKRLSEWEFNGLDRIGGETFVLRARSRITGISYTIHERTDWDHVNATIQRAMVEK